MQGRNRDADVENGGVETGGWNKLGGVALTDVHSLCKQIAGEAAVEHRGLSLVHSDDLEG